MIPSVEGPANTHRRHLQVAESVPEVLNGIETDNGGAEEADPLHAAHTSNAQSSQAKPDIPLE